MHEQPHSTGMGLFYVSVEAKPKPQTSKAFAVWKGGNGRRG